MTARIDLVATTEAAPQFSRHVLDELLGQILDVGISPQIAPVNYRRNSAFKRKARAWLAGKTCLVCGGKKKLQAHHLFPVHIWPSLEMDERHWVPLCRGNDGIDCHLVAGHAGNFAGFCPFTIELAGLLRKSIRANRVVLAAIRAEGKKRNRDQLLSRPCLLQRDPETEPSK